MIDPDDDMARGEIAYARGEIGERIDALTAYDDSLMARKALEIPEECDRALAVLVPNDEPDTESSLRLNP